MNTETIETLPALLVQVEGRVISTNLEAFQAQGMSYIAQINTDPKTDEEFEVAAKVVKRCKDSEDLIDTVTAQALGQMTSVDQLVKAMAALKSEFAQTRLGLSKKVTENKAAGKLKITGDAQFALMEHIAGLNKRLGGQWVKLADPDRFQNSIKGLSSFSSMRTKVAATLDAAKIEASEIADRIELNRQSLAGEEDWTFLFPDFGQVCTKASDDFAALLTARVSQEKTRRDVAAEHTRKEEAARVAREELAQDQRAYERTLTEPSLSDDQRGKTEKARPPSPQAAALNDSASASTPPQHFGGAHRLDEVLRDNARMLLDTLLEIRTMVKPGGKSFLLIDAACAKVGVTP